MLRLKQKINSSVTGKNGRITLIMKTLEEAGVKIPEQGERGSKLVSSFDDIERIYTKEQYVKIDDAGNSILLTEDEITNEVKEIDSKVQLKPMKALAGSHQGDLTDKYGYLHQTLSVIYIGKSDYLSEPNTPKYIVCACNEWLKEPANLLKDAFSLVGEAPLKPSKEPGALEAYGIANRHNLGSITEERTDLNVGLHPEGISTTWTLIPYMTIQGQYYDNLSCYMNAVYVVGNTSAGNQLVRIWTKYVHAKVGIAASVGWSLGDKLPGISFGPTISKTEDGFSIEFWTNEDYK